MFCFVQHETTESVSQSVSDSQALAIRFIPMTLIFMTENKMLPRYIYVHIHTRILGIIDAYYRQPLVVRFAFSLGVRT